MQTLGPPFSCDEWLTDGMGCELCPHCYSLSTWSWHQPSFDSTWRQCCFTSPSAFPSWGFPGGSVGNESTYNTGDAYNARETQVRSLGQEMPVEKERATHSSILAWEISQTEEPRRVQSVGSQWVGRDLATKPPPPPPSPSTLLLSWSLWPGISWHQLIQNCLTAFQ